MLRLVDLTLDPATRVAMRGEMEIELTAREFALLEYLLRNPEPACLMPERGRVWV